MPASPPGQGWKRIFWAYGLISGAVLVGSIATLVAIYFYGLPVDRPHPNPVSYFLKIAGIIVFVGGALLFVRHALDSGYRKNQFGELTGGKLRFGAASRPQFQLAPSATETVIMKLEGGAWKGAGYFIK